MSKKAILGICIVGVIIAIGAVWYFHNSSTSTSSSPTTETTSGSTSVSNSNNSDESLNQDMNTIDSQMTGLNSDNDSADEGINNPNQ